MPEYCFGSGLRMPNVLVFTSNATYTPTAGARWCQVEIVGAGGGVPSVTASASSIGFRSGGGAGSYIRVLVPVSSIANKTVTVGQGVSGSDGGASSIDTLIVAPGGSVGKGADWGSAVGSGSAGRVLGANPVADATSSVGQIIALSSGVGTAGSTFMVMSGGYVSAMFFCSPGGSTPLGTGGPGVFDGGAANTGGAGTGYGSGYGGGFTLNGGSLAAAAGRPGVVIITEFF